MADKTPRSIRLFVASPGDVAAERALLPDVVKRLNRVVAQPLGAHLDLWRWEDDASPGLHRGGPQALIDPQVDRADLVLVILWNRFGTPTPTHGSGTEQEIERAVARWRREGTPRVMIFDCRRPANLDSDEALDQKGRVLALRRRLQEIALTVRYEEVEDFERRVYDELAIAVREIVDAGASTEAALNVPPEETGGRPAPEGLDLRAYLAHVEQVCGSIELTGLLREKAAPAVPLEEVYVGLSTTRPGRPGERRRGPG